VEVSWNHVETPDCVNEGFLSSIDVPVGGAVSDHHSFEVEVMSGEIRRISHLAAIWPLMSSIASVGNIELQIVLVNLPGAIWNINSSIAFSRKIKVIFKKIWIFLEEQSKSSHLILRSSNIIPF
jgi:hypothetical protein